MSIAESILHVVRTTVDVDVVVEGVARASVSQVLPVVTFNAFVKVHVLVVSELVGVVVYLGSIAAVVQHSVLILPLGVVVNVEHVILLGNLLPAVVGVVADLYLTGLTALGGHQDNTVGTTATVDGGRRSVLQHGDVLDVVGRNVADTVNGESIDNVQRVVRLCD